MRKTKQKKHPLSQHSPKQYWDSPSVTGTAAAQKLQLQQSSFWMGKNRYFVGNVSSALAMTRIIQPSLPPGDILPVKTNSLQMGSVTALVIHFRETSWLVQWQCKFRSSEWWMAASSHLLGYCPKAWEEAMTYGYHLDEGIQLQHYTVWPMFGNRQSE